MNEGVAVDGASHREGDRAAHVPAALALQAAAGNQAVATLVRAAGVRGVALTSSRSALLSTATSGGHLQRVLVQRGDGKGGDGNGSEAEKDAKDEKAATAEKEAIAKASQSGSPSDVPQPATSHDAQLAADILDGSVGRGTMPEDQTAELKNEGVPALVRDFNLQAGELGKVPAEYRSVALGKVKEPEGGETDDAAVSKVVAIASDLGVSAPSQLTDPAAAPEQAEDEREEANDSEEEEATSEAIEDQVSSDASGLAEAAKVKPKIAATSNVEKATDNLEKLMAEIPLAELKVRVGGAPVARKGRLRRGWDGVRKFVKRVDDYQGPSPEAPFSGGPAAIAAITGPLGEKKEAGGQGNAMAGDAATAAGGVAGALDLAGNLARMWQGIERMVAGVRHHKGIHRFTCKDTRQGLGAVGQGAAGATLNILSLAKNAISDASSFGEALVGPVASAAGAVLSFITAGRAFRQTHRATRRTRAAQLWERSIKSWKRDERMAAAPQQQQNQDLGFLTRLVGVVRKVRKKAQSKSNRKFVGGMFALVGGSGGVFLAVAGIVGGVAAANIWNPIGWTLAGLALGGAIGLGLWRLWRWWKRDRNRAAEAAKTLGKGGAQGTNDEDVKWLLDELKCGKSDTTADHLNWTGHINATERFLREVLGKDPEKAKTRKDDYLAGKFKGW